MGAAEGKDIIFGYKSTNWTHQALLDGSQVIVTLVVLVNLSKSHVTEENQKAGMGEGSLERKG